MVSSVMQSQRILQQQEEKLARVRHTCAHILAMAVQKLFPGIKVATSPVTETGVFYDFDSPVSFTPEDLEKITMMLLPKANGYTTQAIAKDQL
ncbi:hypothetical protein [Nodularia chucula]|uniref:hypothetical protein n=1 Tax=Nodularia chucula TaxID=3093667 RepID=UPI0039C68E38